MISDDGSLLRNMVACRNMTFSPKYQVAQWCATFMRLCGTLSSWAKRDAGWHTAGSIGWRGFRFNSGRRGYFRGLLRNEGPAVTLFNE